MTRQGAYAPFLGVRIIPAGVVYSLNFMMLNYFFIYSNALSAAIFP